MNAKAATVCAIAGSTVWHPDCRDNRTEDSYRVRSLTADVTADLNVVYISP